MVDPQVNADDAVRLTRELLERVSAEAHPLPASVRIKADAAASNAMARQYGRLALERRLGWRVARFDAVIALRAALLALRLHWRARRVGRREKRQRSRLR